MSPSFLFVKLSQASILLPILSGTSVYAKSSKPFKILTWFYIFSGMIEITATTFAHYFQNNMPVLHFFTVVEMTTYLWVYSLLFKDDKFLHKFCYVAIIITFGLALAEAFVWDGIWKFNTISRSTGAFFLVALTLTRLYTIMQTHNDPQLLKRPHFWLLIGVLFYFSTSFFFFIFVKVSLAHNREIFNVANTIHVTMNILCNFIFAYAFLCHRKTTQ